MHQRYSLISMKGNQRKLLLLTLIFLLSLIGGCKNNLDLEKAKEFGKVSENFEKNYRPIIEDIYKSCMRRARFVVPVTAREDAEKSCLNFGYAQEELLKYHEFLADYTTALRKLASDEIVELKGPGELTGALLSLPIPDPGFKEASSIFKPIVEQIVSTWAKAIANQYRTQVLEDSIEEVNKDVQLLIVNLARVTDLIYRQRLDQEAARMRTYYTIAVEQEFCKKFGNPKDCEGFHQPLQLTAYLVDKQWKQDEDAAEINKKLDDLNSYLETLKKMANLHQDLYISLHNRK
jgi:hypothetical protein